MSVSCEPNPAAAGPAVRGERRPGFPLRRDFVLLLVVTFAGFVNYAVLLTVVPMWAVAGGAGAAGAGATTGVFMGVTVATQLGVPWLLRRIGYRWVLVGGTVALGVPAITYAASPALPALIAVSAVRGVGFGLVTVAGAGMVGHLLPRWAHGRGAGFYGLAIGTPNLIALPLGVWAATAIGYVPLFVVLTIVPALGALAGLAITGRAASPPATGRRPAGDDPPPARTGAATDAPPPRVRADTPDAPAEPVDAASVRGDGRAGTRAARRAAALRPLAAPWLLLWTAAIIAGALLTFLPIAVPGAAAGRVPLALLAFSGGVMVSRWGAGVLGDRRGTGRTLPYAVLSAVLGAAGLVAAAVTAGGTATTVAMIAGALAVGLGFGAIQNDTLLIMFASGSGYGPASAVWNTAFDAGTGAAAIGVGVLTQHLGYPAGFAATGAAALACLPLALRHRGTKSDRV